MCRDIRGVSHWVCFQVRIDGAAAWTNAADARMTAGGTVSFDAGASTLTLSNLPDGLHSVEVRAVGTVSGVDVTPATVTWRVDHMAPGTVLARSRDHRAVFRAR